MFEPDKDGVYARISVTGPRFWFALGVQAMLGLCLIYLSLISPAGPVGKTIIVTLGVLMLVMAYRLRSAAQQEVLLTDAGIEISTGEVIAPMDQITGVSRGAFALKPSNGFAVTLRNKHSFHWVPGLWWRFGKRVGIGGMTSAGPAKFMAEQIALRLSMKDAG